MEGDDVEGAHRPDGQQQHGQVGAGAVAVTDQAQRQQRVTAAGLVRHERGEKHCRGGQQGEPDGVGEAVLAEPGDGVDKGDHAAGSESRAEGAELAPVGCGGQQRAAAEQNEQPDGDVDEEHPPPPEGVGQHAAEEQADHDAEP